MTASVSTSLAMTMRRLAVEALEHRARGVEDEFHRPTCCRGTLFGDHLQRTGSGSFSEGAANLDGITGWTPQHRRRTVESNLHLPFVEQIGVVTTVDSRPVLHQILLSGGFRAERAL